MQKQDLKELLKQLFESGEIQIQAVVTPQYRNKCDCRPRNGLDVSVLIDGEIVAECTGQVELCENEYS